MLGADVVRPSMMRPDLLWPSDSLADREQAPEWFDPETGRHRPPPAFVELFVPDPDCGEDPRLGVGCEKAWQTESDERCAQTVRWQIPRVVVDDSLFTMLAAEITALAGAVAEGLSVAESPHGRHQRLTPAAAAAREEIGQRLKDLLADWPMLEVHEIDEADHRMLEQLVHADIPDKDLPAVVEEVRSRITPSRVENRVVIDNGLECVTGLRDAARARVRDRLAIVAALSSADRSERDELLRRIVAWDNGIDSYRALGKVVGLSHTTVRNIVRQATVEHDLALDHLPATLRSLSLAWDPPEVPEVYDDGYDDCDPDWNDYDGPDLEEVHRLAHLRLKTCAVCEKPPVRLVRRWRVGTGTILDSNDPHCDRPGYPRHLGQSPTYDTDARWAVCGTACAREVINTDRARPTRRVGDDEYYNIERFHYTPHDSEVPEPLIELRRLLTMVNHDWDRLAEAAVCENPEAAAQSVVGLRRGIVRAAEALAEFRTYTPPPRRFLPGDPEPTDLNQVRHGDDIYTYNDRPWTGGPPEWHRSGGDSHTWNELTELANGDLHEIPVERLDLAGLTAPTD